MPHFLTKTLHPFLLIAHDKPIKCHKTPLISPSHKQFIDLVYKKNLNHKDLTHNTFYMMQQK